MTTPLSPHTPCIFVGESIHDNWSGVDCSVKVMGVDGGKIVAKLALPSSTAYSLLESMQYCLRYGMDQLEIIPMTRGSITSAAVPATVVPVEG